MTLATDVIDEETLLALRSDVVAELERASVAARAGDLEGLVRIFGTEPIAQLLQFEVSFPTADQGDAMGDR